MGVFLLCFIACKNEQSKSHTLYGHWNLIHGELNEKEAPGLERIFFEFSKDSVKTNFTQSELEETGSYLLEKNKIIQKTAQPIEFEIIKTSDSVLELATELRGMDFKLRLKRDSFPVSNMQ